MAKASLLLLAAGLGSRYGGIKQMAPVGKYGEFVLDYSIYDAIRAGFDQIVLVIRPELEEPLRDHFAALSKKVDVRYVVQERNDLPEGYECPAERSKPWGTAHAIWAARHVIDSPFAAINSDDFYGRHSFAVLADFLRGECSNRLYGMVGFKLSNTLSEHGTVSRGVAASDEHDMLVSVNERSGVERCEGGVHYKEGDDYVLLTGDEPVSLNFWGFTPHIFSQIESQFVDFLEEKRGVPGAEFYIPFVVDTLVQRQENQVRILHTPEKWFGMTYSEDRALVAQKIEQLTRDGVYPEKLF